jgi:hypothetical protein
MRSAVQARDVFDLYILMPQAGAIAKQSGNIALLCASLFEKAKENARAISFEQFRDTVVSYLAPEDREVYDKAPAWEEIKLKAAGFIDKIEQTDA